MTFTVAVLVAALKVVVVVLDTVPVTVDVPYTVAVVLKVLVLVTDETSAEQAELKTTDP